MKYTLGIYPNTGNGVGYYYEITSQRARESSPYLERVESFITVEQATQQGLKAFNELVESETSKGISQFLA